MMDFAGKGLGTTQKAGRGLPKRATYGRDMRPEQQEGRQQGTRSGQPQGRVRVLSAGLSYHLVRDSKQGTF